MLQEGYVRGVSPNIATLERAVDQIEHVQSLSGGSLRYVGLGTDLDGGYGCEQTPADLDRYRDLQKLVGLMQRRGYSDADIEGVFHGNWMRFFGETLPES